MRRVSGDAGNSTVEYALIAVCIAALVVLVVFALGGYATGMLSQGCERFKSVSTTGNASDQDC